MQYELGTFYTVKLWTIGESLTFDNVVIFRKLRVAIQYNTYISRDEIELMIIQNRLVTRPVSGHISLRPDENGPTIFQCLLNSIQEQSKSTYLT